MRENLAYRTNLHFGSIFDIQICSCLKKIFTASYDGSVYVNELYVRQNGEYKFYNRFSEFKGIKPKIDAIVPISELYEFKITEIKTIDAKVEMLIRNKNHLEKSNKDNLEVKRSDYETDLKSLEDQVIEPLKYFIKINIFFLLTNSEK